MLLVQPIKPAITKASSANLGSLLIAGIELFGVRQAYHPNFGEVELLYFYSLRIRDRAGPAADFLFDTADDQDHPDHHCIGRDHRNHGQAT